MTIVYFIRHAQADNSVRDGRIRPLTEKGMKDRSLVTAYLQDKHIDLVFSSPFKRAVDTVADFAERSGLRIETVEDFRERKSDRDMGKSNEGFSSFMERQWADFSYTYSDGECLSEVQERNIAALHAILTRYREKRIVIGTHATTLSTIINYYDRTYGYRDFQSMVGILPWAVQMSFDVNTCLKIEKIDLFHV